MDFPEDSFSKGLLQDAGGNFYTQDTYDDTFSDWMGEDIE